jgi:hypothetical protein
MMGYSQTECQKIRRLGFWRKFFFKKADFRLQRVAKSRSGSKKCPVLSKNFLGNGATIYALPLFFVNNLERANEFFN